MPTLAQNTAAHHSQNKTWCSSYLQLWLGWPINRQLLWIHRGWHSKRKTRHWLSRGVETVSNSLASFSSNKIVPAPDSNKPAKCREVRPVLLALKLIASETNCFLRSQAVVIAKSKSIFIALNHTGEIHWPRAAGLWAGQFWQNSCAFWQMIWVYNWNWPVPGIIALAPLVLESTSRPAPEGVSENI